MANKIEQIIGEGAVSAVDFYGKDLTEHIGQAILGRLDAAGLAVRPLKATEQMARDALPEGLKPIWYPMFAEAYEKVGAAFDPSTWEPTE